MAKNVPATTKDSSKLPLGHATENKDASAYTGAKFFPVDTKDPIGKYTQPRPVPAAPTEFGTNPGFGKNLSRGNDVDMSVGYISKSAGDEKIKTAGVKIRGTGAAIKGVMSRGPLA